MKYKQNNNTMVFFIVLAIPIAWIALLLASYMESGQTLKDWLSFIPMITENPFKVTLNAYSLKTVGVSLFLYGFSVMAFVSDQQQTRKGEEYGSAKWGTPKSLDTKYRNHDKDRPDDNFILSKNVRLGMDSMRHKLGLNNLIIGGTGSGKSRGFSMPNAMNCSCSYIITDPKGEITRNLAPLYRAKGIPVTVFNLVDTSKSDGFNPMAYLENDIDVLRLINSFIKNTTPEGAHQSDPFWEKSENALLCALILYLKHEAPEHECTFPMVAYMLENCSVAEDDEEYQSPMDVVFEMLEEREPNHVALRQWSIFKKAKGRTAMSILVSAAVRLSYFSLPEFASICDHDDMHFENIGEKQRVIFLIIPDNDSSLDFFVGMFYSSAFLAIFHNADEENLGALPVHVRIIMDEFANTPLPKPSDFLRILSTCRSRNVSIAMIIQGLSQLKAIFKERWEDVLTNSAAIIYLGGNEPSTHEQLSKQIGKGTIGTQTRGVTKGRSGSSSRNYQATGRELLMPDEVRALPYEYALLLLQGEKPVLDLKYDITKHPNYELTTLGGAEPYVHVPKPMPEILTDLQDELDPSEIELIEFTEDYTA